MVNREPEIGLIVNADDFGQTRGMNVGIIEAHVSGILTSATLMTNMPHAAHALELAKGCPNLGIGLHVNLTTGRGLNSPNSEFPGVKLLLLKSWMPGAYGPIRAEIRAQVQWMVDAGVRITHMDSHKHVMVHPTILRAAVSVAQEFGIPAIRVPLEDGSFAAASDSHRSRKSRMRVLSVNLLARSARSAIKRTNLVTTDRFFGIAGTGDWNPESMARAVNLLRPGTTEFMVHPGHVDDDLRASGTRLLESRESELRALTSPEVAEAIKQTGAKLVNYGDLAASQLTASS